MKKNNVKVGKVFGNPDAPINEIVRHMRRSEMEFINHRLEKIRAIIAVIFNMAEEDILGDQSEGLVHILDNAIFEFDELRRRINGETEKEEQERFRKEREKKAA